MATATQQIWPGITVLTDQDWITVESDIPVPDPSWRFIDAAGHGHFYAAGYPTLKWIIEPCTMGHGDDCESEGHYECGLCGETITPGTKMPQPERIPGVRSVQVKVDGPGFTEVYQVTHARGVEMLATAMRDAARGSLGALGELVSAEYQP